MDLASCTTSAVPCDDTGTTTTGVWPVVAQVVFVVLLGLVLWWALRSGRRRRRTARVPQRRVHVSADGELVAVEHRPRR